jgi:hypothetical protein
VLAEATEARHPAIEVADWTAVFGGGGERRSAGGERASEQLRTERLDSHAREGYGKEEKRFLGSCWDRGWDGPDGWTRSTTFSACPRK